MLIRRRGGLSGGEAYHPPKPHQEERLIRRRGFSGKTRVTKWVSGGRRNVGSRYIERQRELGKNEEGERGRRGWKRNRKCSRAKIRRRWSVSSSHKHRTDDSTSQPATTIATKRPQRDYLTFTLLSSSLFFAHPSCSILSYHHRSFDGLLLRTTPSQPKRQLTSLAVRLITEELLLFNIIMLNAVYWSPSPNATCASGAVTIPRKSLKFLDGFNAVYYYLIHKSNSNNYYFAMPTMSNSLGVTRHSSLARQLTLVN